MTGVKILGACERGVQQMSMWLKSCTGPFPAVSGDLEQALQEGCSNPPGVGWDRCPQLQTGMPCSFSAADIETCTRTSRERPLLVSPLPGRNTRRRDCRVWGASAEGGGADRWHGTGLGFVSWIINRFLPVWILYPLFPWCIFHVSFSYFKANHLYILNINPWE